MISATIDQPLTDHERKVYFLKLAGAWDVRPRSAISGGFQGEAITITLEDWKHIKRKQAMIDDINVSLRSHWHQV